jgi:Putative zinc-finger
MRHPREALALREELSELERARLDAHVTSCAACRGLARQLDAAQRALAVPEPPMQPPPMRPRRERGAYGGFVAMTAAIAVLLAVAAVVTSIRDARRDGVAATAPPGSPGTVLATPQPTPVGWPARTVAEVSANLARDENFAVTLRGLTSGVDPDPRAVGRTPVVGTPLLVRGLRPTDAREYLVPVLVDDRVIAVMRVAVDAQDRGTLVATRGWSSAPSFPAVSAEQAKTRAASSAGVATGVELVWTLIRGTADELSPFWRVTHASGRVSYVFEDGSVQAASDMGVE